MSDNKIEKVSDKVNDIDKNLSVLSERLLNFLNKIEDLEKNNLQDYTELNSQIVFLRTEMKDLKNEFNKTKEDIQENSKNRKIINSITWLIFTSVIGLIFFLLKNKITL